jgi:hypothetical protein
MSLVTRRIDLSDQLTDWICASDGVLMVWTTGVVSLASAASLSAVALSSSMTMAPSVSSIVFRRFVIDVVGILEQCQSADALYVFEARSRSNATYSLMYRWWFKSQKKKAYIP